MNKKGKLSLHFPFQVLLWNLSKTFCFCCQKLLLLPALY